MRPETLKSLRVQAGLLQTELAERSGVSRTTISNIEAGVQVNPGFQTVEALAQVIADRIDGDVDTLILQIFRGALAIAEKRG